jgi:hypothetical protein
MKGWCFIRSPIIIAAALLIPSQIILARDGNHRGGGGINVLFPSGVTMQAIDGETLTNCAGTPPPTTCNNTHSYYARNGFTNAASSTFNANYNNGGWDDPRFFAICQDYSFSQGTNTAVFLGLGLSCSHRVTGDFVISTLSAAGIYAFPQYLGYAGSPSTETVGFHVEEPPDWASVVSDVQSGGNLNAGHFRQVSLTANQIIYGPPSGTPGGTMQSFMSSPISTSAGNVHLDMAADDMYYFAGSLVDPTNYCSNNYFGGIIYGGSTIGACNNTYLSANQAARGDHYGDMVDIVRSWTTTYPAPVGGPYIETEDGLVTDAGVREILPQELTWAAWSTVIHGTRMINYFGATSAFGSQSTFGFNNGTPLSGAVIYQFNPTSLPATVYNQATITNGMIKNLAPIINSPFVLNYASVTPVGYVFPTQYINLTNGIDIMSKWYTGGTFTNATGTFGNGFYIFTTVRGSGAQTNINATFTLAGSPNNSNIPVVGEGRTITISSGHFSDVFANAYTIHIYGPIPYP